MHWRIAALVCLTKVLICILKQFAQKFCLLQPIGSASHKQGCPQVCILYNSGAKTTVRFLSWNCPLSGRRVIIAYCGSGTKRDTMYEYLLYVCSLVVLALARGGYYARSAHLGLLYPFFPFLPDRKQSQRLQVYNDELPMPKIMRLSRTNPARPTLAFKFAPCCDKTSKTSLLAAR